MLLIIIWYFFIIILASASRFWPPVCLSVYPVPQIFSIQENVETSKMTDIALDKNNGLQVKGQGHWERKCKNRFSRQKWTDLRRQTKTKMVTGPFYTYRRINIISGIGLD